MEGHMLERRYFRSWLSLGSGECLHPQNVFCETLHQMVGDQAFFCCGGVRDGSFRFRSYTVTLVRAVFVTASLSTSQFVTATTSVITCCSLVSSGRWLEEEAVNTCTTWLDVGSLAGTMSSTIQQRHSDAQLSGTARARVHVTDGN